MHALRPRFLPLSSFRFAAGFFASIGAAQIANAQWTVARLHPAGAVQSTAYSVLPAQQAGAVASGGSNHAGFWSGTAASWIDLTPPGSTGSEAYATSGTLQVGMATFAEFNTGPRAILWRGTASSWTDLTPLGTSGAAATGISGTQQVGAVSIVNNNHASLWTGTAESWVDLSPLGSLRSAANGTSGTRQVGYVQLSGSGEFHAALWSGTAASWIDLNPAGSTLSVASAISGPWQVGTAGNHATLWSGTASSSVDLHPAGAQQSQAFGVFGTYQVGMAEFSGANRASLWSGTASSWEDLSQSLPGVWYGSRAQSVWSDGATIFVAGYGSNAATGRTEALLWTRPICRADFNRSGGPSPLSVQDIFDFLNAWFSNDPAADFNGNGLSVQDIFDFLNAWFAGC